MTSLSSGSRRAATGASADAHGASTSFTRAEVAARAAAGASVFVVDGDVIDFGGFAHPGGHAILRRHAGEDVSAVFHGRQAGDGRRYAHSDSARRMLRRLRVGTIADESRFSSPLSTKKKIVMNGDETKPTKRAECSPSRQLRDRRARGDKSLQNGGDRKTHTKNHLLHRGTETESPETETDRAPSSVGSDDDASREESFDDDPCKPKPRGDAFETTTKCSFASGADLRKPLFAQVGALGARGAYAAWVYEPESAVSSDAAKEQKPPTRSYDDRSSLRFFQNATLEFFSKSPWYLVPATWVPVALVSIADGWGQRGGISRQDDVSGGYVFVSFALFTFVAGYAAWSGMEYGFHRFVFHRIPSGRLGAQIHFLTHGCHHKAPGDTLRLTFPPAAAAPVVFFFQRAFRAVAMATFEAIARLVLMNEGLNESALERVRCTAFFFASFFFSGCLLGYVAYDCTHFALHVADGATLRLVDRLFGTSLARKKSKHLRHHFVDHARAFGISSERWDRLLRTEHACVS
jgi:cytochrome b involved in lipid metabolism/sterol desaturase/sphingolipid hydroxylase (fatty acid hydroxylase superfamily)